MQFHLSHLVMVDFLTPHIYTYIYGRCRRRLLRYLEWNMLQGFHLKIRREFIRNKSQSWSESNRAHDCHYNAGKPKVWQMRRVHRCILTEQIRKPENLFVCRNALRVLFLAGVARGTRGRDKTFKRRSGRGNSRNPPSHRSVPSQSTRSKRCRRRSFRRTNHQWGSR